MCFEIGPSMRLNSLRRALYPIAAAASVCLGTASVHAADAGNGFAVRGLGSQACSAYVSALSKPEEFAHYGNWLMGYATAHNRILPDTYDIIPTEPGVDFPNVVAVICRTNSQMLLETAASSAVTAIKPLRQTASSPLVVVSADGKSVSIHQESLKRLQAALIAKQVFKGAATGTPSPQFTDALKVFQRREAIPVTGLPDIDTFIRAIVKH